MIRTRFAIANGDGHETVVSVLPIDILRHERATANKAVGDAEKSMALIHLAATREGLTSASLDEWVSTVTDFRKVDEADLDPTRSDPGDG